MFSIHMHCFGTTPYLDVLKGFIKGYGVYIKFDNFIFKKGGCIETAKRNL